MDLAQGVADQQRAGGRSVRAQIYSDQQGACALQYSNLVAVLEYIYSNLLAVTLRLRCTVTCKSILRASFTLSKMCLLQQKCCCGNGSAPVFPKSSSYFGHPCCSTAKTIGLLYLLFALYACVIIHSAI